nr:DUF998 domain-containing protein [uncultured Methanoregula sp.]
MNYSKKALSGILIFLGAAVFLFGITISEILAPGYSLTQAISDLGTGSTAYIFNTSIELFGLFILLAVLLLSRGGMDRTFLYLLALAGTGALCTGLFPETTGTSHILAAITVFLFGGLSAIYSAKVFFPPWGWISPVLGIISLAALVFLSGKVYLGLGFGGIERMAAYCLILWALGTGGFLMAGANKDPAPQDRKRQH